jgi:hypothetical protein
MQRSCYIISIYCVRCLILPKFSLSTFYERRSWDSSVGLRCGHPGLESQQGLHFSLIQKVQTDPGSNAASSPMRTGSSLRGDKSVGE